MSTVKNNSGLTSMSHGLLDGCDEICGDSAGSGAHDHGHHLLNLLLVSNLLNFFSPLAGQSKLEYAGWWFTDGTFMIRLRVNSPTALSSVNSPKPIRRLVNSLTAIKLYTLGQLTDWKTYRPGIEQSHLAWSQPCRWVDSVGELI